MFCFHIVWLCPFVVVSEYVQYVYLSVRGCICMQVCVDRAVMGFSAVLKRVFKWSQREAGRTGQTADVNTER